MPRLSTSPIGFAVEPVPVPVAIELPSPRFVSRPRVLLITILRIRRPASACYSLGLGGLLRADQAAVSLNSSVSKANGLEQWRPPWDMRLRGRPSAFGAIGTDTGSADITNTLPSLLVTSLVKPHCMHVIYFPYWSRSSNRSPEQRGQSLNQNMITSGVLSAGPSRLLQTTCGVRCAR